VIDDYSNAKEYRLPPTWTVRIGKISHSDNAAETMITVLKSNSSEDQFGPDRAYELLLPIRLINRVTDFEASEGMRQQRRDQSINLREKQVQYYPALLVGKGRAPEIMTKEAIRAHFETPLQILQDLERLLDARCIVYHFGC
jgi:hypothetical protein